MKNLVLIFCHLVVIAMGSSCLKQTESITPIAPVKTLAQLQREAMMSTALKASGNNTLSTDSKATIEEMGSDPNVFYLNLKYNLKNVDVFESTNLQNGFEQIGNSLLRSFAVIFLKITGERTIDVGELDLDLPDLKLDFNVIKSIKVKRVYLMYNKDLNESTGNIADFSFLKTLNLKNSSGAKLISYSKANNHCDQKCLDFTIDNGEISGLLKKGNPLKLTPTVTISSFPRINELKIDGEVDLQIGLVLPF